MRANPPPFKPFETKEEREANIRSFIETALAGEPDGRADAILVLALSPESPVAKALLSISNQLADRRLGAAIVFAGGATAAKDETWSLSFSARFLHEIRLTTHPRVLDAHEQIIVGSQALWYGDCMRRDPWKRDAFASFLPGSPDATRTARATFSRLWDRAQSIYRNTALSSVVLSTSCDQRSVGVTAVSAGALASEDAVLGSLGETLAAWQPSTRH